MMTRKHALSLIAFTAMLGATMLATASAQDKHRDLLTLIGEDAGLCIELRGLSRQRKQFSKTELFRRLEASKAVRSLVPEKKLKQFRNVKRALDTAAGKPVEQLLDGVFGESVVLALYAGRNAKPAGVLLARARDRKTLDEAVALWNRIEPGSKTDTLKHEGRTYYRRRGGKSGKRLYYARLDAVFVLSDNESMVTKVLGMWDGAASAADQPLAKSATYQAARKSLHGDPVLTAFLNPRAWDAAIAAEPRNGEFPRLFWKNCRWAMAGVRLDGGLVLQAVLDYDGKSMPDPWQSYVRAASRKSDLLNRMPATALVAWVGRFDPALLQSLLDAAEKQGSGSPLQRARSMAWAVAGFDVVKELLPQLRPGIGYFVIGRGDAPAGTPPFHALVAMSLAKPAGKPGTQRRQRLERGLAGVLQFLTRLYNIAQTQKQASAPPIATVKSKPVNDVRVTWAEQIAGFQPGFALAPQYLLFASSPDLVAAFLANNNRLVNDPGFRDARKRFFPEDNQILYVNTAGLRQHLTKHGKPLQQSFAKAGASADKLPLKQALEFLGLADAAFLATQITDSRIRITVGVTARAAK